MNIERLIVIGSTALSAFLIQPCAKAADVVNLNVTGNIMAAPCQVKSDSINIAVDLGQNIGSTTLQGTNSASPWVPFSVSVINCPAGLTQATIQFQGTADSINPSDMYKNMGTATNIAVQLQGAGGEPFGNGKSFTGYIGYNGYTYNLRTRAYSQNGNAMPGTISSAVTATFTYQ